MEKVMKDIFWKLIFDILKNHMNFIMKSKRFGACSCRLWCVFL